MNLEKLKRKYMYDNSYSQRMDAFLVTMKYIENKINYAKQKAFYSSTPNKFKVALYLFNEENFQGWMYRSMLRDIIIVLREEGYTVSCNDLNLCVEGETNESSND